MSLCVIEVMHNQLKISFIPEFVLMLKIFGKNIKKTRTTLKRFTNS